MSTFFDSIVIGVGSMGSSCCYHLASRGNRVLGIEQFTIPHEYGSHAGQSRIIRKAYFEKPEYVPLLNRAYENWKALENETGTQLYFQTGLLYFGPPDHLLIKGVRQSASLYNIGLDRINKTESIKRFPQFNIPGYFEILFEPDAGFVTPEKAIQLYTEKALEKGAEIHTNEKVVKWEKKGKEVIVTTDKNIYHCNKLIITAGAWAGRLIPDLSDKIRVTRQFVAWIKPRQDGSPLWHDFALNNFPCWLMADDTKPGCYYGFPVLPVSISHEPVGLKLAHHFPALETDPDHVNRQMTEDDEQDLEYVFKKYFSDDLESILSYKICLYANSPDEDFIIDMLQGYGNQVIVACGFSGHGFKFVPVIGEILADLATKGQTDLPADFLGVKRFLR